MKKTTGKVFFRFIVHILLIALLSAFYVGAFEKIAEAQQNYPAPVITGASTGEAEVSLSDPRHETIDVLNYLTALKRLLCSDNLYCS